MDMGYSVMRAHYSSMVVFLRAEIKQRSCGEPLSPFSKGTLHFSRVLPMFEVQRPMY